MQNSSHRTSTESLQKTSGSQRGKEILSNWIAHTEKDKGVQTGPALVGGSCERGKVSTRWQVSSLVGRSAGTEGELWSLRAGCSDRCVQGKTGREPHRGRVPGAHSQPETRISWAASGWVLGRGRQPAHAEESDSKHPNQDKLHAKKKKNIKATQATQRRRLPHIDSPPSHSRYLFLLNS